VQDGRAKNYLFQKNWQAFCWLLKLSEMPQRVSHSSVRADYCFEQELRSLRFADDTGLAKGQQAFPHVHQPQVQDQRKLGQEKEAGC